MSDYLIHHGIKGQRWGVRRYQNEDGTLTVLGKKRNSGEEKGYKYKYVDKDKNYQHGSGDKNVKRMIGNKNHKVEDLYSQEQAARDIQVYSKGASKRIAKRVFEDGSLQGARSKEADRIESFRRASKISSRVTPVTTAVATGLAVTNALINDGGMEKANAVRVSISAGILAGKIAHELAPMAVMALGGYSPSKRY